MSIQIDGSSLRVTQSVRGNVFPRSESEVIYPVLVDASRDGAPIGIEGSLYGKSLRLIGAVAVGGPVVARGDLVIQPMTSQATFHSGLSASESISVELPVGGLATLQQSIDKASVVVRGDVSAKNVSLENTIVFGSIKAVNCRLKNCVVLGTAWATESLIVTTSTLAGYLAQGVTFEGPCMMVHSIGESSTRPVFSPAELPNGDIFGSDIRFYPALREAFGIVSNQPQNYPQHSCLSTTADWVKVQNTKPGAAARDRWVLSIGGRISDVRRIRESISLMAGMLRCGFEFDHYAPAERSRHLARALAGLNADESWILRTVCRLPA